ncbi:MAG: hypothetical protein QXK76_01565 [Candidatus Woesearchaeota archaeon]
MKNNLSNKLNNKSALFLLFILLFLAACSTPVEENKNLDELASCITSSGAKMYGTEWCPHCKNQKQLFGSSFKLIKYIDCDKYKNECINAGIEGYPTWIINNSLYPGTQSLYFLAEKTGCIDKLVAE